MIILLLAKNEYKEYTRHMANQMMRKEMAGSSQLQYLQETYLLDYSSPSLVNLVHQNGWNDLDSKSSKIEAIYNYVRDQIPYGYAPSFQVCASEVLKQGKGNCITKTTLLMALLRTTGIPCRLKAARIEKVIHRGLLSRFSYKISPRLLHHTWVELFYKNHWIEVGGHIVDKPYISKLQSKFPDYMGSFYGYGIAVLNFKNPPDQMGRERYRGPKQSRHRELGYL